MTEEMRAKIEGKYVVPERPEELKWHGALHVYIFSWAWGFLLVSQAPGNWPWLASQFVQSNWLWIPAVQGIALIAVIMSPFSVRIRTVGLMGLAYLPPLGVFSILLDVPLVLVALYGLLLVLSVWRMSDHASRLERVIWIVASISVLMMIGVFAYRAE